MYRQGGDNPFERLEIDIMQFSHTAMDRGKVETSQRVAMWTIMFQHRGYSVVQIAFCLFISEDAIQERVFAVTLFYTPPS